jgi:beta-lactamase class A
LVAGVPGNIEVAHKFGERTFQGAVNERQLHDCGIIYAAEKTYMLCVMTRGNDFNALSNVIKEISAEVYSYVTQK